MSANVAHGNRKAREPLDDAERDGHGPSRAFVDPSGSSHRELSAARLTPITPVAVSREPACPMCVARRTVRTLEGFRTDTFFCPSCDHVWEARKPRAPTE
jgi:hypothetical protein